MTGLRRGWSADAVVVLTLVVLHFTLYRFFGRWPAMPNLLIGGLLLAALRMQEPVGVGVLLRERASLGTGEAVIGGVLGIAGHANGAAILDLDEDAAVGVAEAADRRVGLGCHGSRGGSRYFGGVTPLRSRKSWISH